MAPLVPIASRRAAYVALVVLTIIWGVNWVAMKYGLLYADPVIYNIERTVLAAATLFAVMAWEGRRLWPQSWRASLLAGFFQTTINFTAVAIALATGGAGRTAVLVFTMPFWTLLLAWPVLGERVRGSQWLAVAAALIGLTLIVEPWSWSAGDLAPKLWATLGGLGWAAGTVIAVSYQRRLRLDMLNVLTWQMLLGILPICAVPFFVTMPPTTWNTAYVGSLLFAGVLSSGLGYVLWTGILTMLPTGTASLNMMAIPVIALMSSMLAMGERLSATEWLGIAAIGVGLAIISRRAWRAERTETPHPTPSASPSPARGEGQ